MKTTSIANLWDATDAKGIASDVAGISGLYCGPAVVGWIAAVWNKSKGRDYDYDSRLKDKTLFKDGPREFRGKARATGLLGIHESLSGLLRRETQGELALSSDTYYQYGSIHDALEKHDRPIVICLGPSITGLVTGTNPTNEMHYVVLYKSIKEGRKLKVDRIKFYWMDNGVYGRLNGGNPGLYDTDWRDVGIYGRFTFGAKRVVKG